VCVCVCAIHLGPLGVGSWEKRERERERVVRVVHLSVCVTVFIIYYTLEVLFFYGLSGSGDI